MGGVCRILLGLSEHRPDVDAVDGGPLLAAVRGARYGVVGGVGTGEVAEGGVPVGNGEDGRVGRASQPSW